MKKITLIFSVLLLIVSCEKYIDDIFLEEAELEEALICDGCDIQITKDESRLTQINEDVIFSSVQQGKNISSKSFGGKEVSLELVAELAPLFIEYNGEQVMLNANHVTTKGGRIAASYSLRGEPYSGAVDVLNISSFNNAQLEATLLFPDRDIDAISFIESKNYLVFGGGFDAAKYYGGDYPSFFGRYQIKYNKKSDIFSIAEKNVFHSLFGNKLRSLKQINGVTAGAGGGNSGVIFAFDEKSKTVIMQDSNETQGLFILDTSVEKRNKNYDFIAVAFDNSSKELKAFYYDIEDLKKNVMKFSYEVTLGVFPNMDVEAKHSLVVPKAGVLAVSLGSEGIGIFHIETDANGEKNAIFHQQVKSEILDAGNSDHVVNSFIYSDENFYIAAGEAGLYVMSYSKKNSEFDGSYSKVEFPPDVSVNSIAKDKKDLVIATTLGLSLYSLK